MTIERSLEVYDTTLRDGLQTKGVSVSVAEKIRIARLIDSLGLHYIEGGWPGSNPKDTEFFARAKAGELGLERALLAAFGSTRRRDFRVHDDPLIVALLESGAEVITIVGKSSSLHVKEALQTEPSENLKMISETITLLHEEGRKAIFDAEQFFDGYASDPGYAREALAAAVDAGAACVVMCDTNGGTLPDVVASVTREVVEAFGKSCRVGIHTHNDLECGVANSLASVANGATHVQGTFNGLGERCGNANLVSLIPDLQLKLGYEVVNDADLRALTRVAREVADVIGRPVPVQAPFVGENAFAHKAGFHISAVTKSHGLYEHVDPATVGNSRMIVISEMAGRSAIVSRAGALGFELDPRSEVVERALARIEELEKKGYSFDQADASFELILRTELGLELPSLRGVELAVTLGAGNSAWKGTVELEVGADRVKGEATAVEPLPALVDALNVAVQARYPDVEPLTLRNHTVRRVRADGPDAELVQVHLSLESDARRWGTVGVAHSPLDAYSDALMDGFRYLLATSDQT